MVRLNTQLKTDRTFFRFILFGGFPRLGLPLPLPQLAMSCECGKPLDKEGYHLSTCKIGGGPVWSHHSMVTAWFERLNQVALTHAIEPCDCYSSSQPRPDIAIYNATDFNVEIDISLEHPWCSDVLPAAALNQGSTDAQREEKEIEKYHEEEHASTISSPLDYNHFGHWGNEGQRFLHQLSL